MSSSYNGNKYKYNPLNLNANALSGKEQPLISRAGSATSLSSYKPLPPISNENSADNDSALMYSGLIMLDGSSKVEAALPHAMEFEGISSIPPSALPNTRSYTRPSIHRKMLADSGGSDSLPVVEDANISIVAQKKKKSPKASEMTKADDQVTSQEVSNKKRVYYRSDFSHALEPKVQIPRDSRTGRTPRNVEVERRKRLYSKQKIGELVVQEAEKVRKEISETWGNAGVYANPSKSLITEGADGAPSRIRIVPDFPFEEFADLHYFDNTEFEYRDIQDWLNIRSFYDDPSASVHSPVVQDGVQWAKIPIPAKGFNTKMNRWIDCLAVAFDHRKNLWKIQWRLSNGWDLEKVDISEDSNEDENIDYEKDTPVVLDAVSSVTNSMDPRSLEENEEWLHRYKSYN